MKLLWSATARAEMRAAFTYIASQNPKAARRVLAEIRTSAAKLALFPSLGRPGRVAGSRELVITRTPYVAAYCVRQDAVIILHVFHGARLWPSEL